MVCLICRTEWALADKYGENICPACGQKYAHDEGQHIVLTDEQLELLRSAV
jgi:hypothetical protein